MPLEAPSPLKLPPHRGEGGLGGGVGERLRISALLARPPAALLPPPAPARPVSQRHREPGPAPSDDPAAVRAAGRGGGAGAVAAVPHARAPPGAARPRPRQARPRARHGQDRRGHHAPRPRLLRVQRRQDQAPLGGARAAHAHGPGARKPAPPRGVSHGYVPLLFCFAY